MKKAASGSAVKGFQFQSGGNGTKEAEIQSVERDMFATYGTN